MKIRKFCFACDLKDNPQLIAEYKQHHAPGHVWPEVIQSLKDAGVVEMQIYLTGNRMFMVMETDESFDPQRKAEMDAKNAKVQDWEKLMWNYQQALPWAEKGAKWIPVEKVFEL